MLVIQSLVRVRNLGFLGSRLSVEQLQSNNITFRLGSIKFTLFNKACTNREITGEDW